MAVKRRIKKDNKLNFISAIVLVTALCVGYLSKYKTEAYEVSNEVNYNIGSIPVYEGKDYVVLNDNVPEFDSEIINTNTFEIYGELDSLGRCTKAFANVSRDTMPTEERGSIGMIKPSGWHTVKYDIVSGKYLYNRCHLIGFQLTGENANEQNLITCTRQTNTGAMLEFENKVANYIKETGNHVLYRSTPIFEGDNMLASGIQLEGLSVEDDGEGIKFNVYLYNVQEGIEIDYKTGESSLVDSR